MHIFILALNIIFICFFFIFLVHIIMFLIVFVSPSLTFVKAYKQKAMMNRSIFQSGPNVQLTTILQLVAYGRSPRLLQHLNDMACRIGGSQLVEDGVCRQRRDEERAKSNVMSPDRAYSTLVTKDILGGVHRYKEAT